MEFIDKLSDWAATYLVPVAAQIDVGAVLGLIAVVLVFAVGRRVQKKLDDIAFSLAEMRAVGVSTNRLEALQELREILTVSATATRLLDRLEEDIDSVRDVRDVNVALAQRVGEMLQELREIQPILDDAVRGGGTSGAPVLNTEELELLRERQAETAAAIDRLQRDIAALKDRPAPSGHSDAPEGDDDDPARRQAREALAAFVRDGNDL